MSVVAPNQLVRTRGMSNGGYAAVAEQCEPARENIEFGYMCNVVG